MVFTVTLAVFSGRPDPQWQVSLVTNAALFNQIQDAIAKGQGLKSSQMPSILGYKGFLVQKAGSKEEYLFVGKNSVDVQTSLIRSIPPKTLSPEFTNNLIKAITGAKVTSDLMRTKRRAFPFDAATKAYWRDRQMDNNCYNYATNIKTNTYAQPGNAHGIHLNTPFTFNGVKNAAIQDGLAEFKHNIELPPPIPNHPTTHLVALVVATGLDGKQNIG